MPEEITVTAAPAEVLAVRRSALESLGTLRGLSRAVEPFLELVLNGPPENTGWVPRDAHDGAEWLELVPYVALRRGFDVWCYRRGAAGAEAGLHGRLSIGLGGHVERGDLPPIGPQGLACFEAAVREVYEEVRFFEASRPESYVSVRARFLGPAALLHDPDTAVGRRHLGLAYLVDLPDHLNVRPREAAIRPVGWLDPSQLYGAAIRGEGALEPWSLILARYLLGFDPAAREVLAPAGADAVG